MADYKSMKIAHMKAKQSARQYRVFVSYSTKDLPIVEQVRAALKGVGAEPFVAEHDIAPGESLRESILTAIRQADAFVLLWSTASSQADWVRHEVGIATGAGRLIIPVLLSPEARLPSFLSDTKYLSACGNLQKGLAQLSELVAGHARSKASNEQAKAFAVLAALVALLFVARE